MIRVWFPSQAAPMSDDEILGFSRSVSKFQQVVFEPILKSGPPPPNCPEVVESFNPHQLQLFAASQRLCLVPRRAGGFSHRTRRRRRRRARHWWPRMAKWPSGCGCSTGAVQPFWAWDKNRSHLQPKRPCWFPLVCQCLVAAPKGYPFIYTSFGQLRLKSKPLGFRTLSKVANFEKHPNQLPIWVHQFLGQNGF